GTNCRGKALSAKRKPGRPQNRSRLPPGRGFRSGSGASFCLQRLPTRTPISRTARSSGMRPSTSNAASRITAASLVAAASVVSRADRVHTERGELRLRLRADAVETPNGQRPDSRLQVGIGQYRQAVGLVELGADLGEQLVRRHGDGAAEAGRARDIRLDGACQAFGNGGTDRGIAVRLVAAI